MFKLHFDGGKRNHGITYGFIIYYNDKPIFADSGFIKGTKYSSNVAEYIGLIAGLYVCSLLEIKELTVYGDSLLVINQMLGKFRVKSPNLQMCHAEVKRITDPFDNINYIWIPREQNNDADRMSRSDLS